MSGTVTFLNVGQGHAAVVASDGTAAVVDCPHIGPDAVVSAIHEVGIDGVQAIFVTHRDLDHCAGVPDLLERLDVGTVYLNFAWAVPPESSAKVRVKAVLSSIFSKAERDAVPIEHVYAGAADTVGSAKWRVLAPTVYDAGRASLNDATNRASMVILWSLGARRFLIMGDADHVTIERLLASDADLTVDVLLASHHGAKIANTAALLDRATPSFAVISVGRVNAYGHPHEDTLHAMAHKAGCRIMCTQVNALCEPDHVTEPACAGSVRFVVDAGELTVEPSEGQHDVTIAGWSAPRCLAG
ncbi:MAG: MBL fold metallo-hydrolase [Actinobacteria bacterium]|nr:MBL fold metallo-hydrolase [Actinomycetota bacterium]